MTTARVTTQTHPEMMDWGVLGIHVLDIAEIKQKLSESKSD